ncbi:MAG TPA: isochorismatase family cysteine hydrolase [Candidatus Acidoferrales bacterium]|nr:isochorismatase family cysteine hydrolase [Candidatus Acidoferrales bacterium]
MSRPALLIIDMQHDFVDPSGPVPCEGATQIVPKIRQLIAEAHDAGIPCIFTQEVHRAQKVDFGRELDGDEPLHCVEGSIGARIVEELVPTDLDYVVTKRRYSGFFGTDLQVLLSGLNVDTLYITGAATDVCVYLTAMDAHQFDFRVKVLEDCVAGTSKDAHRAALAAIEHLQKGAVVTLNRALEDFRKENDRRS